MGKQIFRVSPASPARRTAIVRSLAAVTSALFVYNSFASNAEKLRLKIAAAAAPDALAEFVAQTGLQVLFDFDAVRQYTTREINGRLDPAEALHQMFDGSGLTYEFINERTVSIRPLPAPPLILPASTTST